MTQPAFEGMPEPVPAEKHENPAHVRLDVDGFFSATLTAREAWPDGEPEEWSAADLAREITASCATPEDLIKNWNLDVGYDVTVVDAKGNRVSVEFKG